jgi:phage baseplate assembly protein W
MVRQLLLTSPGERVNLPEFGCGLRALVFAPRTDALAATVRLRVIQGLDQWLAGVVNVAEVAVGAASSPGTLEVTVSYTLVETQTDQTVTVTVG